MTENPDRNTFRVERSTNIAAPPERIFDAIVDFHEWVHWSPWEGIDPKLQRTYSGPEAGVGTTYEWKGTRKVGTGRMEIIAAQRPTDLAIKLNFIKPFKAQNTTRFAMKPSDDTTQVTWTMTGPKTFMSKVMGIFMSMDKFVGRDFDKGLAQLKAYVEG
jgi:uncharacterized protein YndB with AHSA1/START domain